jgi:hypothetical protein
MATEDLEYMVERYAQPMRADEDKPTGTPIKVYGPFNSLATAEIVANHAIAKYPTGCVSVSPRRKK